MENGIFMFGFCLKTKGRKERWREKKKKERIRGGFYIKFTEEFGQAVISAAVKADRLFIESYQTLCC